MILKTKLLGHIYQFSSLREVMAKANEVKSGDTLAGIAAGRAVRQLIGTGGGGGKQQGGAKE